MNQHLSKLALSLLSLSTAWYAIPLRLIVGFGFFEHGYAKLARGPEDFINVLHAIGVPVPILFGWATILVEILGGLSVIAGALIPLAAIPMLAVLLVAIFTVHLPNGFSSIKLLSFDAAGAHFGQPGYETDLLYASAARVRFRSMDSSARAGADGEMGTRGRPRIGRAASAAHEESARRLRRALYFVGNRGGFRSACS